MRVFLAGGQMHAQIDHLTPMEVCRIRPLLLSSLNQVRKMQESFSKINENSVLRGDTESQNWFSPILITGRFVVSSRFRFDRRDLRIFCELIFPSYSIKTCVLYDFKFY